MNTFIQSAKRVIDIEQQAIGNLHQYLDEAFVNACHMFNACRGKVIVCGMGKSGHIGHKIAATLASTGTPAFFMHPSEANHGDLGMVTEQDVVLAISNSGETDELLALLPVLARLKVKVVAMTGNATSSLARHADVHIKVKVEQEACPLGLAPTASTTATLAMGDAIAVALLEANGFSSEDFAISHPGGSLGRKLLLKISDIMVSPEELPLVEADTLLDSALIEISAKGLGMVGIVDAQGCLLGVFTDGDLRRILDARLDLHTTPISSVMTEKGITASADTLAAEVLNVMELHNISALFIINQARQPIGAINMHHLLKAGVV